MPEKSDKLQILNDKIAACTLCDELTQFRIENNYKTVPGEGNVNAQLMVIGEAPGENEAEQGRPFVGRAGKMLDDVLLESGWKRDEVFIANILKCRPAGNRNPTEQEAKNCLPYLNTQVRIVQPSYIVCVGKIAAYHVLQIKTPFEKFRIGEVRKKIFRSKDKKILCTYHPSYLLRLPAAYYEVLDDLKLLRTQIEADIANLPTT